MQATGLLILICSLPVVGFGLIPSTENYIYVDQFSNEQGLRQSMVKQVLKDSRGFLWATTGDGLHLLEGKTFRAFRPSSLHSWDTEENIMRHIVELEPGIFVISTNNSILVFDSYTTSFRKVISRKHSYPVILPVKAGDGIIFWFPQLGFYLMNKNNIVKLPIDFPHTEPPPADFIPVSAITNPDGSIFIWSEQGILEISANRNTLKTPLIKGYWTPTPGICISLVSNRNAEVFVLTETHILIYTGKGNFRSFARISTTSPGLMTIDEENNFWIFEKESKILTRFSNNISTKIALLKNSGKYTETLNPYIIFMWIDDENNFWFGTDGDGLLRYSPGFIKFTKALTGFTRAIATDKNANVWVGTFKNGLWKLSPDLSNIKRIAPNLIDNQIQVNDLLFDSKERLWLVTHDQLMVLGANATPLFRFPFHALSSRFIRGEGDTIYLSTNHYTYTFLNNSIPELIEQHPNIFIRASVVCNGLRWTGTQDGLHVYKVSDGFGIEHLDNANCMFPTAVTAMARINNEIWVATGKGIRIFDTDKKVLEIPGILEQLEDETIYSFSPDNQGRVWISLNMGLACISEQRDHITYFDNSNNLQGLEFNSNAWHVSEAGLHYWGGINGINGLNTTRFMPGSNKSKALLARLEISDTLYNKGIPANLPELIISWKAAHLACNVISNNYAGAHIPHFSFFLTNYDNQWHAPVTTGYKQYRNLPSGQYRLLVKCMDEYGNWGPQSELLKITVTTPIWKTWWFIIFSILFVLIINTLVIRRWQAMRYRRRINHLQQQNALEKERLRISRDLHDDLGAGLSLIILNASLTRKNIEDPEYVENHLNRIYRNAKDLYDNINNLIWLLKQDVHSLDNLFIKIREVFSEILSEAVDEYEIRIPDSLADQAISREMSRNIFLIIKEAVNNAIKHARATSIEIVINNYDNLLDIYISDNGIGFDIHNVCQGNGLYNMLARATALGGNCSTKSAPGSGTQIHFTIPLEKQISITS